MFLGTHFFNSTADSGFCKNICGMTDFARTESGSTDLLTSENINMNLDAGKYHSHIININFHARTMAQKHFFFIKNNTFLSIKTYPHEEAKKRSSLQPCPRMVTQVIMYSKQSRLKFIFPIALLIGKCGNVSKIRRRLQYTIVPGNIQMLEDLRCGFGSREKLV